MSVVVCCTSCVSIFFSRSTKASSNKFDMYLICKETRNCNFDDPPPHRNGGGGGEKGKIDVFLLKSSSLLWGMIKTN